MRIINTSTEITTDVKTHTTAIIAAEAIETTTTIGRKTKEAIAIIETLMTVTETDFKTKVLKHIKTGARKEQSMLICNQLAITVHKIITIVHKIITSNKRMEGMEQVMDTTSELIWI